jgi:Di-haem cytochrome c peroxidase
MLRLFLALIAIPLGLDLYLPVPENNPITSEKISLGRRLFFDRRLSRDGSISCATCHNPNRAFSTALSVATGVNGRQGRRNAPALINRAYGRAFFWDGRMPSLEEQVLQPIQDPNEMNLTLQEARLASSSTSRRYPVLLRLMYARFSQVTRHTIASLTAPAPLFPPSSSWVCRSFEEKAIVQRVTWARTSPTNNSITPASPGAMERSPMKAVFPLPLTRAITALSRRRRFAKSPVPRPPCTTAAWPHSKMLSNSIPKAAVLTTIPALRPRRWKSLCSAGSGWRSREASHLNRRHEKPCPPSGRETIRLHRPPAQAGDGQNLGSRKFSSARECKNQMNASATVVIGKGEISTRGAERQHRPGGGGDASGCNEQGICRRE